MVNDWGSCINLEVSLFTAYSFWNKDSFSLLVITVYDNGKPGGGSWMLFYFSAPNESYKRKERISYSYTKKIRWQVKNPDLIPITAKKLQFRILAGKQAVHHLEFMAHITGQHHRHFRLQCCTWHSERYLEIRRVYISQVPAYRILCDLYSSCLWVVQ